MTGSCNISHLIRGAFIIVLITVVSSCEVQVIEVSEAEFLITKEWKVKNVYFDGELILNGNPDLNGGRIENFRIKFNEDLTYDLRDFADTEYSGNWYLSSGFQQLILEGYILEKWTIEIGARSLNMNFITPPNKPPAYTIRYELEAVPGQ